MEEYESEKNSSIKVSKTSTNKFSWEIKLYFNIEQNEEAILKRIKKINDKLEETYKNE